MSEPATAARSAGFIAKRSRRLAVALTMSIGVGLLMLTGWRSSPFSLFLRTIILGLSATAAFALFEVWPRSLPRWLQRWALQVVAVGVFMPVTTVLIYVLSTPQGAPPFWENPTRMNGWTHLTFAGILLAPWTALAAIVRQKEAFARDQELAFALERSELERQALDARLHLLQAQVAPHFLFNTLANVQHLVETDAAAASRMLDSLIHYLRAALPQMREGATTLGREIDMARAFLDIHRVRMGSRLDYVIDVPESLKQRAFPPMMLISLVENAIKHGVDPCCDNGRITIRASDEGGRLKVSVADTGEGVSSKKGGGVGLTNIRERLRALYGGRANLVLEENAPRGVVASIEVPA